MNHIATGIKESLDKISKPCSLRDRDFVLKYLGTKKKYLCIKAPDRDKILSSIVRETKNLPAGNIISMLDELFCSGVYDYINFAGKFLSKSKRLRENITFGQLEKWIKQTEGWAEDDVICQSLFSEMEVMERWDKWEKAINKFSEDNNIQLRRASLVLQCKPARESNNPELRKLAFETIEKLKGERDILITKAISWLLRSFSEKNGEEVREYLELNHESLPKIAYRETMRKIETGKK
jgi:3-methyladenine DNA glycosylase AlkD